MSERTNPAIVTAVAYPAGTELTPNAQATDDPLLDTSQGGRVQLSGAVGETLAFQLEVRAIGGNMHGVEISAEDVFESPDMNATSSATTPVAVRRARSADDFRINLFRLWPVTVERFPQWYLRSAGPNGRRRFFDACVPAGAPLNGQPFDVSPTDALRLWVEVVVSRMAVPGRFETAVTFRSKGKQVLQVPVEVTLRDLLVTPDRNLAVLTRVDLRPIIASRGATDAQNFRAALADADTQRAVSSVFQLLHDHGLAPYTDQLTPSFTQNTDGSLRLDWTDYDAFCSPFIDGSAYEDRRPIAAWPWPLSATYPDPVQYDGIASPAYRAILMAYAAQVRAHFDEKGWSNRAWVNLDWAPGPDPTPNDLTAFKNVVSILQGLPAAAAARAPFLMSTLIPQAMAPYGWLDHHPEDVSALVDVWATPTRYCHRSTMTSLQSRENKVWTRPEQPPFGATLSVVAPRSNPRSLPWQAFVERNDGILLLGATQWPANIFDSVIAQEELSDDAYLVYPGGDWGLKEAVPSVRLKLLQLGLQDEQLLRTLADHGRSETAKLLAGSVIQATGAAAYGDNFLDGVPGRRATGARTWRLARTLLLDEAAEAVSERPDQGLDAARNRDEWARFLSATRRVEAVPESTRIELLHVQESGAGSSGGDARRRRRLQVTHQLSIRNAMIAPVEGAIRLGALPISGRSRTESTPFGPVSVQEMARRDVIWEMQGPLPVDLDGHYLQRITLDTGFAAQTEVEAVLSIVQAPPATNPITIDGALNDWLPNEFNAAGDFRLFTFGNDDTAVSHETGPVSTARRPRAQSQTVAYFCHDDANLYVGLHAASPPGPESAVAVTTELRYQGLAPDGEDLIEILIDPTNHGTRIEDVYHLVVKATGVGVFEKGVGIEPPIGRRTGWTGPRPRYGVLRSENGWSAEIAIPFVALGAKPSPTGVWGINVTRLEPVRGEYSDWARAPRYCYDPRTLGSLIWAE